MRSSSASSTASVPAGSSSARAVSGPSRGTVRRCASRPRTSSSSCSASGTSSAREDRPPCGRRRSTRSAARARSSRIISNARSTRSRLTSGRSPHGSSITSSRRRGRRSRTRCPTSRASRGRRRPPSRRSSRRSRDIGSSGRTSRGRWEIFHDVLAAAVLGWKTRYEAKARRGACSRRGTTTASSAWLPRLRRARRARPPRPRSPSSRSPSAATRASRRVSRRAASWSRARCRCSVAIRSSRWRSGSRRRASIRRLGGGRSARCARGLARACDRRRRSSPRLLELDRSGIARAGRRRRQRGAHDRPRGGDNPGHNRSTARQRRSARTTARVHVDATTARSSRSTPRRARRSARRSGCACPVTVEQLVASPDGATAIVIAGKPRARVVALPSGERIGRVKQATRGDGGGVRAVRPDSSRARGADRTARLWDTQDVGATHVPPRPRRARPVGRVRRAGTVVAAREHRPDRARLASPRQVPSSPLLFGHTGPVQDVSFGARRPGSSRRAATGPRGPGARTAAAPDAHRASWRGYPRRRISADGAVVTAGADGTIRLWDPGTSIELARPGQPDPSSVDNRAIQHRGGSPRRRRERRPPPHGGGGTSAPRTPGSRELRLVQPGRSLARHRGARPRRHRLGRRERRAGAPLRGGAFGVCRGRAVQRGRPVARDGGPDLRPALERRGRKPLGYLYGPKSPLTAVAFRPDSRTVRHEGGGRDGATLCLRALRRSTS